MYHGIVTEWTSLPGERERGADLYDVALADFQAQMQCLKNRGYDACLLDHPPEKSGKKVIITFDDGEMNNHDHALPILKKLQFPAYFFIIAKRVGNKGYMGWDELKGLHDAGMVIGSHGFSHEILTGLMDTQIEEELRASKRYLERNLEIAVDCLSIPRGFCDDKVLRMAYDAGYKNVFISERPKELTARCHSRVPVKSNWPLKRFKQALDGEVPMTERAVGAGKGFIKRVFGGGVYDWIRRVLLRMK